MGIEMNDDRIAICLGGPLHGRAIPVRGKYHQTVQHFTREGRKITRYRLEKLIRPVAEGAAVAVWVYVAEDEPSGIPMAEKARLLHEHAKRHGTEVSVPPGTGMK